jgi:hypothetical protein
MLWDLREASVGLTPADLRAVVDHTRSHRGDRGHSRVGLLVTSDVAYGFSRIFQAIAAEQLYRVLVFREEAAARAWVRDGTPPPEI